VPPISGNGRSGTNTALTLIAKHAVESSLLVTFAAVVPVLHVIVAVIGRRVRWPGRRKRRDWPKTVSDGCARGWDSKTANRRTCSTSETPLSMLVCIASDGVLRRWLLSRDSWYESQRWKSCESYIVGLWVCLEQARGPGSDRTSRLIFACDCGPGVRMSRRAIDLGGIRSLGAVPCLASPSIGP
jgi:hypothetical protein